MAGLDCQSDGMTTQQDPRPLFLRSVAIATAIVGGVRPDQHSLPTPCDGFNVQELLGHMVAVLERIIIIGSLGDPNEATRMVELDGKSALTEWFTRAGKAADVWSDAKLLGTTVTLPFAKLPGAAAMAIYGSELTVHGWDLARATGQTVQWDDDVCRMSMGAMQMALPPDLPRDAELPFGTQVHVGADAPLIDQLVAWTGRTP
jgi:uncharacterized protein (TIGR03086 family)